MLPIGFDEIETEGFFLISKTDAAKAILNLTDKQMKLWLYLNMVDTFADISKSGEQIFHDIPSPTDIAIKIGCSERRVVMNMRKLEQLGLYKAKIKSWQGYNSTYENAKFASDNLKKGDRSGVKSDRSGVKSDRSGVKSDRLRSQNDQSGSISISEPLPDKDSGASQTLQTLKTLKTLSDPYGEEPPLTAESTEKIGSEEREKKKLTEEEEEKISAKTQERSHPYSELANKKVVESLAGNENPNPKTEFARNSENETASKEESQPSKATSQPQQSESSTTELGQKLSSSPENAANSRPKPKSSSSGGKGFGGRSINEILNSHTRIPRARRELREFYSFGKEDCDEFEKFAESKAKKYREEVVILDSWVLSMLESMVAEYRVWKQKKDYAQRVRASYVAQEQKIESEPEQIEESDSQKPQRSMKEIAAEIRRKRDEELAKKQQNKGKR